MEKAANLYLFLLGYFFIFFYFILFLFFFIVSFWLYPPPPPLNQLWACGGPGAEPLEAFIVPNLKPFDKVLKDVFMEKMKKKICILIIYYSLPKSKVCLLNCFLNFLSCSLLLLCILLKLIPIYSFKKD